MPRDEYDVTDGAAALETKGTERARRRAFEGDAPPSADAIGKAVADALERQRNAPKEKEAPLPEIVRASVRCGYETTRRILSDGSMQMVTAPGAVTFRANETADGREHTVAHGRPVHLKRDAFLHWRREGKVILAQ